MLTLSKNRQILFILGTVGFLLLSYLVGHLINTSLPNDQALRGITLWKIVICETYTGALVAGTLLFGVGYLYARLGKR